MDAPNLSSFFAERYPVIKALHPGGGRRKWKLRVAEEFWNLTSEQRVAYAQNPNFESHGNPEFEADLDPLDELCGDESYPSGILLRTDYSNESAWLTFLEKLHEGEAELASALIVVDGDEEPDEEDEEMMSEHGELPTSTSNDAIGTHGEDEEMEEQAEGNENVLPPSIFRVIDPPETSPLRLLLTSISNIASLRLFNDVDISLAPVPPHGTKRVRPAHRLVDQDGLQEIYSGKRIWIYDVRSNADQSVRVVNQKGGVYGTATGDSWRARVSHICELQVNLASGVMTIDFGGLDQYDYPQRLRNLKEAERSED